MRSFLLLIAGLLLATGELAPPIRFRYVPIEFQLEPCELLGQYHYTPATMAGGVAVFDYDNDGDLDIYFTNGAELPALKKTSPKYWNRLFENDGQGHFRDVTARAGLQGRGYDTGVAVGDYDNDGDWDLFVGGVHTYTLYQNRGDGTFEDVTEKAGLTSSDPQFGPLWSVGGVWLDYDRDGDLDLFIVNYLAWQPEKEPPCTGYCHPRYYPGSPNRLYRNEGGGKFTDVSAQAGIRQHVGKGMGAAMADYDRDGYPDLFVTNDKLPNFLFHNRQGRKFEEVALEAGVALASHAMEVSGMGTEFRDMDNDGWPDIFFVALERETFPLFRNMGGWFEDVTAQTALAFSSAQMAGYAPLAADFDNDGWKDLFVSRGHVQGPDMKDKFPVDQHNTVFHNRGGRRFHPLTVEAGLTGLPPRRHRGAAFGDFNGDGRLDVVVTALNAPAEIWMNDSPGTHHWLDVKLVGTRSNRPGIGAEILVVTGEHRQWNLMTTATGYGSSAATPVHFGLGPFRVVDRLEIRWPSGTVQVLQKVPADRLLVVQEPAGESR